MKIYTIVSPHNSLAKNKIADILKICHLLPDDVTSYDMQETTIGDALFDVSSAGFLVEKKAVLIKNPYFLTGSTFKGPAHDMDKLTAYLNNPSPENVLIFHCPYEKLDERKKIVKLLKKKSDFIKITAPTGFHLVDYARGELLRHQVAATDKVISALVERTKSNVDQLITELAKIGSYFSGETNRELTEALLFDLVPVALVDNVFLLTEALAVKNNQQAYRIFTDLMVQKEEPIKLIVMIANQFRLFKQIESLKKRGLYEKDIATELGVHPYRVKIAAQQAKRFKMEELNDILNQLAEADLHIKTGQMDGVLALELFILGLSA